MEYKATKEHLAFLEQKYGITIERVGVPVPVPLGVRKYGQPFLSKQISLQIGILQARGFQWEDEPYEVLSKRYERCNDALMWWTNYRTIRDGKQSWYDISRVRGLKEFILENPPEFPISRKCCEGAKKKTKKNFTKDNNIDLELVGVRKAEGGVRAGIYKSCFDSYLKQTGCAAYRPLFWFTDKDKSDYEKLFNVTHSKCYTDYGFKRTGCACCPYGGKDLDMELDAVRENEPMLYKACMNVFGDSYEYTKRFYEFRKNLDAKRKKEQTLQRIHNYCANKGE